MDFAAAPKPADGAKASKPVKSDHKPDHTKGAKQGLQKAESAGKLHVGFSSLHLHSNDACLFRRQGCLDWSHGKEGRRLPNLVPTGSDTYGDVGLLRHQRLLYHSSMGV